MESMDKVKKSFIYSGEGLDIQHGNEHVRVGVACFFALRFKSRGDLRSLTALHSACRSYAILYYVYPLLAWGGGGSLISYSDALAMG